jgi:hypothetical protein
MTVAQQPPSLSKVVQAFMAIKDHRTAKRHAWEAEDAALEADQDRLKALMLQIMNTTGAESIRTEHGTAIRQLKTKPSVSDWPAVYGWILADLERFELLEKRVKPTFINQYMNENDGQLPPGVNIYQEFEISVRRPTSAPGSSPASQG